MNTDDLVVRIRYWAHFVAGGMSGAARGELYWWFFALCRYMRRAIMNPPCRHDDCKGNAEMYHACVTAKRAKRQHA